MIIKYALDSSFIISLLVENDVNHEDAKDILKKYKLADTTLIINPFVVEEVSTFLVYKKNKEWLNIFYSLLDNLNIQYNINLILNNNYRKFFLLINKRISYTDATVILDCIKYRAILISFDKEQIKIYNKLKTINN